MKLSNILFKTIFLLGAILPQAVVRASFELDCNGCMTGYGTGAEATAFCADPANGITCCTLGGCLWANSPTVVRVCDGSCDGFNACNPETGFPNGLDVGANSCTGPNSCGTAHGPISDNSCNGVLSCFGTVGGIGANSCQSDQSCWNSGMVGSGSCQEFGSCLLSSPDISRTVGCNVPSCQLTPCPDSGVCSLEAPHLCTESPTKAPTKSPTKAPTKSPTKSPTKAPTKSPTKAPTKSPTKAPTKSPTKAPTKSPTKAPTKSPTKSPTPAPAPKEEPAIQDIAGATGDPHFKTRLGHSYDFHGSCDLVLLHAPDFAHGLGLDIHIRTQARYQYSFIESAALKIGEDILEVGSWGENMFNGVHGTRFPKAMGELAMVTYEKEDKKRQRFEITLGHQHNHAKIIMRSFKDLVSVTVDKPFIDLLDGSVGMLGGANGQMLARDGATNLESNPDAFGNEWQVRDTEPMLFQNSDRFPQYPEACVMPKGAMESRRLGEASGISEEEAMEACKEAGRMKDMDGCVYDILATGDLELAQAGAF